MNNNAFDIANLLQILNNKEVCTIISPEELQNIQKAIVLYASITSRKVINNIEEEQRMSQINNSFSKGF